MRIHLVALVQLALFGVLKRLQRRYVHGGQRPKPHFRVLALVGGNCLYLSSVTFISFAAHYSGVNFVLDARHTFARKSRHKIGFRLAAFKIHIRHLADFSFISLCGGQKNMLFKRGNRLRRNYSFILG